MDKENNEWIVCGVGDDDPGCLHNYEELSAYIEKVGFLPLFRNEIKGFSVEEHANPVYWWSENAERDPWEWRMIAAREHRIAYGKFFCGRAGFISPEWLPMFVNFRRRGRDFDDLWASGLVSLREKKIMDCIRDYGPLFSYELKHMAGFGKNREKNFDGTVSLLQNDFFLTINDFRRRISRDGTEYGWHISQYVMPEDLWGEEVVTAEYDFPPSDSYAQIIDRVNRLYPGTDQRSLDLVIGKKP